MYNKSSLKGAWLRHIAILNFGGPIHVSGMAEAKVVKFCTGRFSLAKGMTNYSQKGRGWAHMTHIFPFATVDLRKILPRQRQISK